MNSIHPVDAVRACRMSGGAGSGGDVLGKDTESVDTKRVSSGGNGAGRLQDRQPSTTVTPSMEDGTKRNGTQQDEYTASLTGRSGCVRALSNNGLPDCRFLQMQTKSARRSRLRVP